MKTIKSLLPLKSVAVVVLVSVAVFSRFIPHLPNLTALGGATLLAGATLRPRWLAFLVPMLALLISDSVLGFYPGMIFSYLAWALIVLGAAELSRSSLGMSSWAVRFAAAFAASSCFFILSNFGVWYFGGMYLATLQGLVECYVVALPFFATQLLGDLIFTGVLFFSYDLVVKMTEQQEARAARIQN